VIWTSVNKLIKLTPVILTASLTVAPLHSFAADPPHYQSPSTIYTVAASEIVYGMEYADLDRDGNLDMIVILSTTDQVGVLRGNGDGTFQVPQLLNVGDDPRSATIGDFNKDGINDIVVGTYVDATVSVLLGKADGQYEDAVFYPSGYKSLSVTSGDFNKDGNLDVAATNDSANRISILYGNGDGSFQTAVTEQVGSFPRIVRSGDFNGDGNLDLIYTNDHSNSISVLLGDGNGGFNRRDYPTGASPYEFAIGDWDGDGVADLAVSANGADGMTILIGNADGSFGAPILYSSGAGTYPLYVDAGDRNGDGYLDILVTTQLNSYTEFLGNGDGTFQSGITYATPENVREVNAEDFNGDGIPDLVLRYYQSIQLMLSKSEGTIAFDSAAYSVSEDDGSAVVTIVRSDSYGPTTVRLTTTNGSASAGTDYTAVMDTISFLAGETVKTYAIPINDNAVYSGNRMFTVTLSAPTNTVSLGAQSSASITIVEDELPDTTAPTVDVTKFAAIDNYDGTPDQLLGLANAIGEEGANVRAYAWNDANDDNVIDAGELSATGVDLGTSAADGSVSAADLGDLPPGSYKYVLTATDAAGNESPRVTSAAISVILSKAAMPQDSEISPTTATFDKNPFIQADVATAMTLKGNTLAGISSGGSTLVPGTDYTVTGNTVTIKKAYLEGQDVGTTTLTFTFSMGAPQTLAITVSDTTSLTYAVTYDGNAADGGSAPTETNKASGVTFTAQANTFTRTGYTFAGWNTQADGGGTAYAAGTPVTMPASALTLYAQWTAIPTYSIIPLSNVMMNPLTAGYASGAQEMKTVTVTRMGTGDLASLATALSGTNASSFTITQSVATTLDSGTPSTTFTVKPKDGLPAGTYTATVTVSATNMTPVAFTVTQVVNRAGGGGSTSSASPVTTDDLVIDRNGVPLDPDTIDTTKPSVTLQVTPKDGVAYVSIPASILISFADKNATFFIEIQTPYGSYRVPVNLASLIPGLQDLLAANNLKAEDVSFKILLTDKSGDAGIQRALTSDLPSGKVMGAIVDFSIEIINIKTKKRVGTADNFSKALVRIIPMPKEMKSLPVQWGAFRYNEMEKRFQFVPAGKVQIDGVWYVMISSLSNSVYVVADNPISFADMQKHWGKPHVDLAAAKGLVEGVGGGRYDPEKSVTRAEFTAMLVRALGRSTSTGGTAPYNDVLIGAWYFGEVAAAKELGLLDFVSDSGFNPNKPLTREEMASMLAAAVSLERVPIAEEEASLGKYKDIDSVDAAYLDDVYLMIKLHILEGTSANTFSPKAAATRAEAAIVFVRTLKALGMID